MNDGVTLLDGPIGTMLEAQGIPTPPPLWSAAALRTHPEAIAALHASYAAAGATVHTAATFRTSPTAAGPAARALTQQAVQLARGAVPADHRVAGSLAPVHDCWRPDLSPPDAERLHRRTAALLAEAGVDLILCETHPHPREAVAATRAAAATGLPVWTSLTPGFAGDLLSPAALAEAACRAADAGAAHVLVNCLPAAQAGPWVAALAATGLPWGVYANLGATSDGLAGDAGMARYAAIVTRWLISGASIIGGCCGTTPAHIAALRETLRHLRDRP